MELNNDIKIQVLLFIRSEQYEELKFRRDREFSIFQWTATILLALCAILLGSNGTAPLILLDQLYIKITSIILVLLIGLFSILWQQRERKFAAKNCQVIADINSQLELFSKGIYFHKSTVLPSNWKDWGKKNLNNPLRFFRTNYITATWILSILAIGLIVIRSITI